MTERIHQSEGRSFYLCACPCKGFVYRDRETGKKWEERNGYFVRHYCVAVPPSSTNAFCVYVVPSESCMGDL